MDHSDPLADRVGYVDFPRWLRLFAVAGLAGGGESAPVQLENFFDICGPNHDAIGKVTNPVPQHFGYRLYTYTEGEAIQSAPEPGIRGCKGFSEEEVEAVVASDGANFFLRPAPSTSQ